MIVALDNTFLSLILNPATTPSPNPATGKPVTYCTERIEALVDTYSKRGDRILIPAPCFAELLVGVPDLEKTVDEINKSVAFDLVPFDARCAIALADLTRKAIASGDKRSDAKADWQKVKFDRQIATIAKVGGAEVFHTDDENQAYFAEMLGMKVLHTWNLGLPDDIAQFNMLEGDG